MNSSNNTISKPVRELLLRKPTHEKEEASSVGKKEEHNVLQ